MVKVLVHHKLLEVLVIQMDLKRWDRAMEVMAPIRQRLHNGQELMIVDIIVALNLTESLGVKGDQMPTILLQLTEDDTSIVTHASFHMEGGIIQG